MNHSCNVESEIMSAKLFIEFVVIQNDLAGEPMVKLSPKDSLLARLGGMWGLGPWV
jgi:hypothetical protein